MTIRAVADTHAIIWYLYDDSRLSVPARTWFDDAALAGDQIALSAISLVEIVYLINKGRIEATAFDRVLAALDLADGVLVEVALDRHVAHTLQSVDRASVPDLPDRIIAATARYLDVPLISRDGKIQLSDVTTIW